ncbi:MAG: PilN domain-containing protein [Bacteriovorax sp.]|nr:PilN domain-containing protein [Bacteriovorax sp.]
MIELNLLEKKQPLRLPNVLGLDLNALNFKMLIFALILYYIPDIFVHNYFNDKIKIEEEALATLTTESTKLTAEIGKNINIKAQLEAYNKQVDKLKDRSGQVDEILKIRTNPKKILEKIARSIPEDLWFEQIKITDTAEITIIGGADSPRSIGEFITVINDSPFFANSITPSRQENKQESIDGRVGNFEFFELKGKIKNFEMRSR